MQQIQSTELPEEIRINHLIEANDAILKARESEVSYRIPSL